MLKNTRKKKNNFAANLALVEKKGFQIPEVHESMNPSSNVLNPDQTGIYTAMNDLAKGPAQLWCLPAGLAKSSLKEFILNCPQDAPVNVEIIHGVFGIATYNGDINDSKAVVKFLNNSIPQNIIKGKKYVQQCNLAENTLEGVSTKHRMTYFYQKMNEKVVNNILDEIATTDWSVMVLADVYAVQKDMDFLARFQEVIIDSAKDADKAFYRRLDNYRKLLAEAGMDANALLLPAEGDKIVCESIYGKVSATYKKYKPMRIDAEALVKGTEKYNANVAGKMGSTLSESGKATFTTELDVYTMELEHGYFKGGLEFLTNEFNLDGNIANVSSLNDNVLFYYCKAFLRDVADISAYVDDYKGLAFEVREIIGSFMDKGFKEITSSEDEKKKIIISSLFKVLKLRLKKETPEYIITDLHKYLPVLSILFTLDVNNTPFIARGTAATRIAMDLFGDAFILGFEKFLCSLDSESKIKVGLVNWETGEQVSHNRMYDLDDTVYNVIFDAKESSWTCSFKPMSSLDRVRASIPLLDEKPLDEQNYLIYKKIQETRKKSGRFIIVGLNKGGIEERRNKEIAGKYYIAFTEEQA